MTIYSGFFPLKMVIFYSYVKLPEGIFFYRCVLQTKHIILKTLAVSHVWKKKGTPHTIHIYTHTESIYIYIYNIIIYNYITYIYI